MQLTQIIESTDEKAVIIFKREDDNIRTKIKNIEIDFSVDEIKEVVRGKKMREIILGDKDTDSMKFVRQDNDSTIEITVSKLGNEITQKFDIEEVAVALRFITN